MRISIHTPGFGKATAVYRELRDILQSSLERFSPRVQSVRLVIEDVNGPRGGVDLQCRCVLYSNRMAPIVISDRDQSALNLVQRVAHRASFVLSERIDRRFKQSRRGDSIAAHATSDPFELNSSTSNANE